jgi:pyruvyltransferase
MLYLIPYGKNFGDELNILLIKRLIQKQSLNIQVNFINLATNVKFNKELKTFSFLGSIMHLLPSYIDVIGTGVNPNYPDISEKLNILSLRGELSRQYLENNKRYKCDDIVFGDPALLIPRLFPEWLEPVKLDSDCVGIIPHFNDIPFLEKTNSHEVCYPNKSVADVISFIKRKKTIISSSLHGIIVAEMLGKDVKWIMYQGSLNSESDFKYLDYYQSTNRYNIKYGTTIQEALSMTIPPKPKYDDTQLWNLINNYLTG